MKKMVKKIVNDFKVFTDDLEFYFSREFIYILSVVKFMFQFFLRNVVWFIIIFVFILFGSICYFGRVNNLNDVIKNKNKIIGCQKLEIQELKKQVGYEKTENKIKIRIIREKVDSLQKYINRIYPGFEYENKIEDALNNGEKIKDIPENLLALYIQEKYIKLHGLNNYELTLKNTIWPLEKETSFTASKNSEYARPRPYKYFGYMHEGLDLKCFYNNSVYAIYDAEVYKKYYNEGGGWSLEIKFLYEWEDGKKQWAFCRFRHMEKIYVNEGDKIKKGDIIAQMGNTGYFSLGKHLHWELYLWNGKKYVNYNPVQNSTWKNKIREKLW